MVADFRRGQRFFIILAAFYSVTSRAIDQVPHRHLVRAERKNAHSEFRPSVTLLEKNSPFDAFSVGERIEVAHVEKWLPAVVTSKEPFLLRPDGFQHEMAPWDEIRRLGVSLNNGRAQLNERYVFQGSMNMSMRDYIANYEQAWSSQEHCRLRRALHGSKKQDIIFAASGGSATCGAGAGGANRSWFNLLGKRLGAVTARNGAQGGTDSFWSSMTLDSVHPDADVIFWEYAINDGGGGSTGYPLSSPEELEAHVELWIRRVAQMPRKPAIVLVYLYDAESPETPRRNYFVSTALAAGHNVLRRFADAGLDLTVIPAGSTMRRMFSQGKEVLANEEARHHPSAEAHVAISDLVAKQLASLASAADASCSEERHATAVTRVPLGSIIKDSNTLTTIATSKLRSVTNYSPRFETPTDDSQVTIAVCNQTSNGHCLEDAVQQVGKSDPTRADRKSAWLLPRCTENGLDKSLAAEQVEVQTTLTVALSDTQMCRRAKLIALDVRRGQSNSHPWMSELAVTLSGRETQIINKQLAKIPSYVENFTVADGTVSDMDRIPLVMRHRFNVFLDLSESPADDVFKKQLLMSLPGDVVDLPSTRCKQLSICAVRAKDDTSTQGLIQTLAIFY